MDLGPYLACDGVNYECTICDRYFCSEFALYTHCRQTSRHQWCERCLRAFVSAQAKNTHLRKSSRHNVCSTCPQLQDFATGEELQDHLVKSHHFCPQCNVYYNSVEQLQEHDITQHHLCVKCGDYFANKNNLQMHQQKHQRSTYSPPLRAQLLFTRGTFLSLYSCSICSPTDPSSLLVLPSPTRRLPRGFSRIVAVSYHSLHNHFPIMQDGNNSSHAFSDTPGQRRP